MGYNAGPASGKLVVKELEEVTEQFLTALAEHGKRLDVQSKQIRGLTRATVSLTTFMAIFAAIEVFIAVGWIGC